MKKKFILLMMMCLLGLFSSPLKAQETVEIGTSDGTPTGMYPIYSSWPYSESQQLFTAGEIGQTGKISEIAFMTSTAAKDHNVTIYLLNTTVENLSTPLSYSDSDKVFEGAWNTCNVDEWAPITLDNVFEYDGDNLVVIVKENGTGTTDKFHKYTKDNGKKTLCYKYSSSSSGLESNSSYYTSTYNNVFRITFAADDCTEAPNAPTNLVATANDHASITLTWDAVEGAKKYNVYMNGNNEAITTTGNNTYTISGLSSETTYSFTVTAVCGAYESDPSASATATTEAYEGPQLYRVKIVDGGSGVYGIGQYLNIKSYNMSTTNTSNVGVANKSDNDAQLFSLEDAGNGNYYLRSAQGYYIECGAYNTWNVDAYQTTPNTPLTFEYVDATNNFYIRNYKVAGTSNYFKSQDSGVYCDAPKDNYQVAIWTLEPIINDNITPNAPTNLVATAIDHASISLTWTEAENAISYNIYDGEGEQIGTSLGTSYTVEGLSAETEYCFTVKSVRGNNVSTTASNSACATTAEAPAIQDIVVGDGSTTNAYIPTYTYYNYSLTQQIYTAEQLGFGAGTISKIAFNSEGGSRTRTIDVYMINTSKETFTSETDWVVLTDSNKVYSGSHTFSGSGWSTIELTTPFEYDGTNILICVDDNTGSYESNPSFKANSTDVARALRVYSDDTNYNPHTPSSYWGTKMYFNNQITFTWKRAEASVTTIPVILTLDDVRMGDYWSEKETVSQEVEVNVVSTQVTNITCSNDFFTLSQIEFPVSGKFTLEVGYNKNAEVTGEQSGTITITSADCDPITVTVTATAYTATEPDAIEAYTTIAFTDGEYTNTPTFANLHDDYVLPSEVNEGETPDAVYKFTLENEGLLTVNVTGTNGIAAIYKEFGENEGPSSDNNYEGYVPEVAASTTFGPYTFDDASEIDNFTFESGWSILSYNSNNQLYGTSTNRIVAKDKYAITSNSKLIFDLDVFNASINVCVSNDGIVFNNVGEDCYYDGSFTIDLSAYNGQEVYIGFNINYNYQGFLIDNLQLTDGSKSRATTPQIDAVQYEAGTYYLVAAAEGEFTMTLTLSELVAPEAVTYTAPEDNAMNMDDPKLTWTFGKYTEEYQVLFGTDPENLDVVVNWTSQLATEYQTSDLEIATKYYWQVNAKNEKGSTMGAVRSFVSALPAPANVKPENEDYMLVEGESNIILNWDAIEGVTYNVYKRGAYNNQTGYEYELLGTTENNSYEITSEYDMDGSYYAVSAVYEEVYESDKTLTDYRIYVTGYGSIKGVVTDGTNPIAGLTFEISGESAFGEEIYIIETDENGAFNKPILEGTYTLTISHYDYEEYVKDGIICVYNTENDRGEIALTVKPEAEGVEVTAAIDGDNANITWTGDFEKYNVYRMNLDNYPQEAELIAEGLTEEEYQDTDWTTLDDGAYQYGVAALDVVSGGVGTIISEGFEHNGSMPEGWTSTTWQIAGGSSTGSYSIYNSYSTSGKQYLITPKFSPKGGSLTFAYYNPSYYDYSYGFGYSSISVLYSTSIDGPWTELWKDDESGNSYETATVDLTTIQEEEIYIAFCNENINYGGYAGAYIDDIVITGEISTITEYQPVWSNVLEKKADFVFNNAAGDNNWHNTANWAAGELPGSGDNVVLNAKAVITTDVEVNNLSTGTYQLVLNSGILKVNGQLNVNQNAQYDGYYLVINDGAQLLHSNNGVPATFKMNITRPETWNEGSDGWQFISTPFTDANVNLFASNQYYNEEAGNYEETDYALFKYDGEAEKEWDNIKENSNSFELQFVSGRGYLASQQHKDVVTLEGTLNSANTHEWTVSYNSEKDLANYHLLGNPFSFDMDWSNIAVEGVYNGFATVNSADGSYDYSTSGTIPVGDGFFVRAIAENPTISYGASKGERGKGEKVESINLIATGANGDDNAIINFADSDEEGFLKLDNINTEIANIYFSNSGKRYAISNFDREITEIPVSFDAKQMGSYTIAAQPQGKFESVILVDRFTGVETNLLLEDYNFTSTGDENHDRFIVKLVNGQQTTDNSHFAYVSGEDLILNIEGSVQIIDVMGRVIYANDVTSDNNRINVSNFDNAAYVIRVINENGVKVQKIIL